MYHGILSDLVVTLSPSVADLAVILVDASQGVLVQTRRHARICALMGIRYFVFAVNKMDLIEYDEKRFRDIENQIAALIEELKLALMAPFSICPWNPRNSWFGLQTLCTGI